MNIVIRVDSSFEIGTGHVMRCLVLAEEFQRNKHSVEFICRENEHSIEKLIENKGFIVNILPEIRIPIIEWMNEYWREDLNQTLSYLKGRNIDLMIVDHYGIDEKWESAIKAYIRKILVIKDDNKRKHNCDFILDTNYGSEYELSNLKINNNTKFLLGTTYTLLRDEFRNIKIKDIDEKTNHTMHLFFGGTDNKNYTLLFAEYLITGISNLNLIIVVGEKYPFYNELLLFKEKYKKRIKLYKNVSNMAELMEKCTVALGAPGTTTWERAAVGLPALYLSTHPNQIPILKKLSKKKVCAYLGKADNQDKKVFINNVKKELNDIAKLNKYKKNGRMLVNINGKVEVIKIIEEVMKSGRN